MTSFFAAFAPSMSSKLQCESPVAETSSNAPESRPARDAGSAEDCCSDWRRRFVLLLPRTPIAQASEDAALSESLQLPHRRGKPFTLSLKSGHNSQLPLGSIAANKSSRVHLGLSVLLSLNHFEPPFTLGCTASYIWFNLRTEILPCRCSRR